MKPRPSKLDDGLGLPQRAQYELRHNMGKELLRLAKITAKTEGSEFQRVYSETQRPLITIVFACASIEGYVNFVGKQLDPDWIDYIKGTLRSQKRKPGIKDKIRHIYDTLNDPIDFGKGNLQQVMKLFDIRGKVSHPIYEIVSYEGSAPPVDFLEIVCDEIDAEEAYGIAENFAEEILQVSKKEDLYWNLKYSEKQ